MYILAVQGIDKGARLEIDPVVFSEALTRGEVIFDYGEQLKSAEGNVLKKLDILSVYFSSGADGENYREGKALRLKELEDSCVGYFDLFTRVSELEVSFLNKKFINEATVSAEFLIEELNKNVDEDIIISRFKDKIRGWSVIFDEVIEKVKMLEKHKDKILSAPIICNVYPNEDYSWSHEVQKLDGLKNSIENIDYARIEEMATSIVRPYVQAEVEKILLLKTQLQQKIIKRIQETTPNGSFTRDDISSLSVIDFLEIRREAKSLWLSSIYSLSGLSSHFFKNTKLYNFMVKEGGFFDSFDYWYNEYQKALTQFDNSQMPGLMGQRVRDVVELKWHNNPANPMRMSLKEYFQFKGLGGANFVKLMPIFHLAANGSNPVFKFNDRVYTITTYDNLETSNGARELIEKRIGKDLNENTRLVETIEVEMTTSEICSILEVDSSEEFEIRDRLALVSYLNR